VLFSIHCCHGKSHHSDYSGDESISYDADAVRRDRDRSRDYASSSWRLRGDAHYDSRPFRAGYSGYRQWRNFDGRNYRNDGGNYDARRRNYYN